MRRGTGRAPLLGLSLIHISFLPVSGEIVEFNAAVDADPSIVNKDPYGEGWVVKVRVSDPAEYDTLLTAEQYTCLLYTSSFLRIRIGTVTGADVPRITVPGLRLSPNGRT